MKFDQKRVAASLTT